MNRMLRLRGTARFALAIVLAALATCLIALLQAHGVDAATPTPVGGTPLACPPNANGINELPNSFCSVTANWLGRALAAAQQFFLALVAIEMAWSLILYALQKDNIGDLLASFVIKLMAICFFYAIILNSGIWLPAIMNSFIGWGNAVASPASPIALDPQNILTFGLDFCNSVFTQLPQLNWPGWEGLTNISGTIEDNLTVAFCFLVAVVFAALDCFIIFVAYIVVAGQVLMTMIEAYIMISAGAVMLGFLGSRWTTSWGERYIGYAVSIGIKLFVTIVILGLGAALTANWATLLGMIQGTTFSNAGSIGTLGPLVEWYLEIGADALVFMMLVMRLPGLASSMMNGSPSLSLGGAVSAGASVAGAVTGIAAGVAGAVRGALSKTESAVDALRDASAAGDKLGALDKASALDALGDAADGALGGSAPDALAPAAENDAVIGGTGGDVLSALTDGDGEQDGTANPLAALDEGETDATATSGALGGVAEPDANVGPDGILSDGSDGADGGTNALTGALQDDSADGRGTNLVDGGTTSGLDDARAYEDAASHVSASTNGSSVDNAATSSGRESAAATNGGASSERGEALRAARDAEREASRSEIGRQQSRSRKEARDHALGAVGSLGSGAVNVGTSALRPFTELNEGGSDGAVTVSLRLPD